MGAGLLASLDANMAQGRALDAFCALTGTYRRPAQRSRLKVLVRLAGNASLPKDSLAASVDNLNARFRTLAEIKNNSPNEAVLESEMIADEVGPVYVKANQLNHIIPPHSGWLGITNTKDALLGRIVGQPRS